MKALDVDGIEFQFDENWQFSKFDDWSYYRNQFSKMGNSIKAIDLIALSPNKTLWLIEVKDYRHPGASVPTLGELSGIVWGKVMSTMAALIPAAIHANDTDERTLSDSLRKCTALRVAVHVEQPPKRSALFPEGAINLANLQLRLARTLKPIDPHPKVESTKLQHSCWKTKTSPGAPSSSKCP